MTQTAAGTTVLLVEDDRSIRGLYRQWLATEFAVEVAGSGREALASADEDVDVVCLDRKMPGMAGREVLSVLRDRGVMARVVMITGVEPDFDIIEMAFDDYLVKPVSRPELLETIRSLSKLSTYDSLVRRHFALSAKKALLAETKTRRELRESSEFAQLNERLERLRSTSARVSRQFDTRDFERLFRDFRMPESPGQPM